MKKILILFLFCLGLCTISKSQNAYYDALKLRKNINLNPSNKNLEFDIYDQNEALDSIVLKNVIGILKSYFPDLDTISSKDFATKLSTQASEYYNPFLKDFLIEIKELGSSPISVSRLTSSVSSLGSLNVTNIADGIAQFLIKRGKEELNVAFFNRLKTFLDSTEECKVLFPQSIEVFKNVQPYQYAEFIQSLREGFNKDLNNLIVGVNELIELPKYQELLKKLPEIRLAIRSSKIVQELSQSDGGILPDSIITQLAALKEFGEIDLNLGNSWKLLDVISQSVRYVPNDSLKTTLEGKDTAIRRWITLSDMNSLVKDPITLKIFLGLVYQKADSINFKFKKVTVSVQEFMKNNADKLFTVSALIENFVTLANDVDRSIKDIKDKQSNHTLRNDDYYTYIIKAINITEYGFKAANTVFRFKSTNKNDADLSDNRYIIIAKNGNDLYKNIYTKNYNNAVMNVYNILDQGFNNKNDLAKEKTEAPNFDSARKEFVDSIKKIEVLNPKILSAVLKYGNFMASVVKAESGEEVEQALESVVLPAGSYSIKQKAAFNVSVNGYIGYAWDFTSKLYAHGIYAPVGISISRGSVKKNGFTLSGFVSLIDVGSIATYRLQDDSTKTLKQDVRLESIFSPSAQIFIAPIRNFPLAIGGGWRKTPKLFYSNKTDFTAIPSRDVFNLSILMDIPFFTIANKNFKAE